jgi:hypothetical protein
MSGLNSQFIAAIDLNESLLSNQNGEPLAGGIVTFYQDQARTTLKAVYGLSYNSMTNTYSYVTLPNPMTLSGIGSFQDAGGNNVTVYYYPFDSFGNQQLYYITVYDAFGNLQFTRQAWPFPASGGGGGGGGSATSITVIINQPANGFTVGQVVWNNAGTFQLALADNPVDAEVIGMVTSVIDANNFNLLVSGQVTALTGLTPGGVYWLSDVTSGLLTLTQPTAIGHISKPLMIATSATVGFFYNFRGKIISAPGFTWTTVLTGTATMAANMGYIVDDTGANVVLTMPTVANVGDVIRVVGFVDTSWQIAQNALQYIIIGTKTTTPGTGGYLMSNQANDCVEMVCVVANTAFVVMSSMGNITVN